MIEIVPTQEQHELLAWSLSQLDDKLKLLLKLRYTEGFTIKQIAELFSKKEAAMRKQLARALQQLREVMENAPGS